MRVEIYETMDGSWMAADSDDESAPLLRMEFKNEFADIPSQQRADMMKAAIRVLGGKLPEAR